MKKLLYTIAILTTTLYANPSTIPLQSAQGLQIWHQSLTAKMAVSMNHFTTQKYQSYCGIASCVTILNAMAELNQYSIINQDALLEPYAYISQDSFFNHIQSKKITPAKILCRGINIQDLSWLLNQQNVTTEVKYTQDIQLSQFEADLNKLQTDNTTFIILNYDRNTLKQKGSGHFSPVGGYNKQTKHVQILDVSRYKAPIVWVPIKHLYAAMKKTDPESKKSRGYILIQKNPNH